MHKKNASLPLSLKPRTHQISGSKGFNRRVNMSPDLHLYSYFSESQSNRGSKFFTNNSNSVSKSTIIKPCDAPTIPKWEIKERLDSFGFRTLKPANQKLSFELFQKDFALWEKTSAEINKILSHFSEDLGEVMVSFTSFNKKVYMDLFEFCRSALGKAKKKVDKYKSVISSLNNDLLLMTEHLNLIKQIQLADNDKIEKEIRDIFGDFVVDTEEIREKIKKLKMKETVPAAEYLKEALEKLKIVQKIPDLDPTSPKAFDISDYETTLNTRIRTIQVSTAQRIINYFESRDNYASKTTQTQEEFIQMKVYVEVKEALDKANMQLNSLNQQLEKSRQKIAENENNIDVLLAEKGRLITENLLKNNEVQNFREREKYLKAKIIKLKADENLIVVGSNPYIKESKPKSPVVSSSPGFFTANQRISYRKESDQNSVEEDEKSEKNSIEGQALQIPSKRNSVMDESKSSFYSSVHSKSSASEDEKDDFADNEIIQNNEEFKSLDEDYSESEEKPLNNVIKNEINLKKVITSKEVQQRLEKYEKKKKPEVLQSKDVKKIITSNEVDAAMKSLPKAKTETFKNISKVVSSEKKTENIEKLKNDEKKTEKSLKNFEAAQVKKKSGQIAKKNFPVKPEKTEIQSKKNDAEKQPVGKKVTFEPEKSTESKTTSAMLLNPEGDKIYSDELMTHSLAKEDSFFKENSLENQLGTHLASELISKDESSRSERKSPSLSSTSKSIPKAKSKSLSIDKVIKPSKAQNSFLPTISRASISEKNQKQDQVIQDLLNYIDKLEKALKTMEEKLEESSNQGFLESVDKTEIPRGPNPDETKQKDPLIYRMPYNPNNIYGLKGDRYFTSKGVFSTQPLIPDLMNSQFFKNFYHTSEEYK